LHGESGPLRGTLADEAISFGFEGGVEAGFFLGCGTGGGCGCGGFFSGCFGFFLFG
jgi:hypothetical protein